MRNEVLDRVKALDWKRAIVLIIAIFISTYSSFVHGVSFLEIPFILGVIICFVLFYFNKNSWVLGTTFLLFLKVIYVLPQFFFIIEFYLLFVKINIFPLILLIIHLNLNEDYIKRILKKLKKSDESKINEYQSKVERFEFNYRYKSKKQLEEIIENKDVMTKEAIKAASNLLDKWDKN